MRGVVRRPRRPALVAVPTPRPGITVSKIAALVFGTALATALGVAALLLALAVLATAITA
jgi:hypothetical protein